MDKPKKIMILIADAGFGHRKAALALTQALDELYGEACQAEIVNPLDDERAPSFLRDSQTDYDRLVRDMPEVYKLRYQISDTTVSAAVMERVVTLMLYRIITDLIEQHEPDVIVAAHPMFPGPLGASIAMGKTNTPYVTMVTDFTNVHRTWLNDSAEMILLPTEEAAQQAVEVGVPVDRLRVTGIPVHPDLVRGERAKAELRQELGWPEERITGLVVGSKRVKNLDQALHVLNHSGHKLHLAVVAGGDDELYEQFEGMEWHHPVHIYNYVDNLADMMRASDFIVCKAGGLVTTEALAIGLPMLLVDVTPGQEEGNAAYVVENGAAELGEEPLDVLEILQHWLMEDRARLWERSQKAAALGRPQSAYQIAELLMRIAERGPLPVPESRVQVLPKLRSLLAQFGLTSDSPAESDLQTSA